jgi:hypothetical protein
VVPFSQSDPWAAAVLVDEFDPGSLRCAVATIELGWHLRLLVKIRSLITTIYLLNRRGAAIGSRAV